MSTRIIFGKMPAKYVLIRYQYEFCSISRHIKWSEIALQQTAFDLFFYYFMKSSQKLGKFRPNLFPGRIASSPESMPIYFEELTQWCLATSIRIDGLVRSYKNL